MVISCIVPNFWVLKDFQDKRVKVCYILVSYLGFGLKRGNRMRGY